MSTAAIGNDGAFIEDGCTVLKYAITVMEEYDSPTVLVPVIVDGEPLWFVSGYQAYCEEGVRALEAAWADEPTTRACVAIGLCIAAYEDAPGAPRYLGLLGGEL